MWYHTYPGGRNEKFLLAQWQPSKWELSETFLPSFLLPPIKARHPTLFSRLAYSLPGCLSQIASSLQFPNKLILLVNIAGSFVFLRARLHGVRSGIQRQQTPEELTTPRTVSGAHLSPLHSISMSCVFPFGLVSLLSGPSYLLLVGALQLYSVSGCLFISLFLWRYCCSWWVFLFSEPLVFSNEIPICYILSEDPGQFCLKTMVPPSHTFSTIWTNWSKSKLEPQWPLWRAFEPPTLAFLRAKLEEDCSSKMKITKWNA